MPEHRPAAGAKPAAPDPGAAGAGAPPWLVRRQAAIVSKLPLLKAVLDTASDMIFVLNSSRQIVLYNKAAGEFLSRRGGRPAVGARPGAAFGCVNSRKLGGACGTGEACGLCGTDSVLRAGSDGGAAGVECRILQEPPGDALDLNLRSARIEAGGEVFTVLAATDISDRKRRRVLERAFFHDVLNTATAVRGFAFVLKEASQGQSADIAGLLLRSARELIEEIQAQRDVTDAENSELRVRPSTVRGRELLRGLAESFGPVPEPIRLEAPEDEVELVTDAVLLRRVLRNILKNAIEACRPGDAVTAGCSPRGGRVEFRVHNPAAMPREVQLQVFQRSFTTKGPGRGLGAYGAKLLAERYLKGLLGFTSSEGSGTTFFASFPPAL